VLATLHALVEALRQAGVPIAVTESIDAAAALGHLPLDDRDLVQATLASVLVKDAAHRHVYDALFDVYFSPDRAGSLTAVEADGPRPCHDDLPTADELRALLMRALELGDRRLVELRARQAVARFALFRRGGAVGTLPYVYRTLKAVDLEALRRHLDHAAATRSPARGQLAARLTMEEHDRRIDWVRQEVDAEVRRLLVAAHGPDAIARRMRSRLPEDVDFLSATVDERASMRDALQPLARKLAAQLAIRRHRRQGSPDIRRTIRRSLAYGGTPIEVAHRRARPVRPQLMVLADVSGSVMMFARFALQLVNALQEEFTRVRSFAFVDTVDEISSLFGNGDGLVDLARRVNRQAGVVWLDGHSDYGNAFETFWRRWGPELNGRTSVLILGDARNNYHAPRSRILQQARRRARSIAWLNPEPREHWDTGDSVIGEYAAHCDSVHECRNLRQLRIAVEQLV
jgi:uncharacterized protein with von Willebrand factor type A (vWA) domain